jgi:hypothetical protein
MREVIKGDGSDGTAALKAYLLTHDNVMSQELYEFSLLPRPSVAGADWIVPPVAPGADEKLLWVPITGTPTITIAPMGSPPCGSISVGPGSCSVTRTRQTAGLSSPVATWSAPMVATPSVAAQVTRVFAVVRGGWDGFWGEPFLYSPTEGELPGSFINLPPVPFAGTIYHDISAYGSDWTPSTFPWSAFDLRMGLGGSTFFPFGGVTFSTFAVEQIGFLVYYAAPAGPPPGPYSQITRSSLVTDASSPLTYRAKGYVPANIKNSGFKSKIGLDVDSLDLEWRFRGDEAMITDPDTGATILTMLQAFRYGLWDGAWVKWRRTYMPAFGDCDSLGAVSMFRGRVAPVQVDRLTAKITVNSITDMFNRQVPAQLIEANNRSLQIGPGLPPDLNPDPSHWTYFQCIAGHGGTVQKIVASQTAPTADQVYAPGTFDLGYLLFQASPLEFFVAQVQHYDVESGYNVFYLFRPLYVDPHPYGLSFAGFVPVPKDQTISGVSGLELPGFPRVPLPEQAM